MVSLKYVDRGHLPAVLLAFFGLVLMLILIQWFPHEPVKASSGIPNLVEQAVVDRDINYCNSTNPAQELDLFMPRHQGGVNTPVVIHVHGGGWMNGDKVNEIEQRYAPLLTQQGIAVATLSYRLSDEATYPAQNDDIHCAVTFLNDNADKYGLDMSRIGIMGDSAGGHLAAMEALRADTRDQVKGVLMLYGVSDLWEQIAQLNYTDTNAIHYLGQRDEDLAHQASPIYADLDNAPPFLLIHGTADTVVPASESANFSAKLIEHHNEASYMPVIGAGHGFIGGSDIHEQRVRGPIVDFFTDRLLEPTSSTE